MFGNTTCKNALIFHSDSFRFIVVVFLDFWLTVKNTSKLERIGNSGTKLDKVCQNLGQNHLVHSEMR